MKILIVSDIHANYEALKTVEPYINLTDIFICLGDIVGYYCQVNEVIEFLRQNKAICILGNHDEYLINNIPMDKFNAAVAFGINFAKKNISVENLIWLKSLKQTHKMIIDNKELFFCHANPWDNCSYLYPETQLLQEAQLLNYDLLAFGHTHRGYYDKNEHSNVIFNPGSIGQNRDKAGVIEFGIFDSNLNEIEIYNLSYDFNKVVDLALKNKAGDFIYKHLS